MAIRVIVELKARPGKRDELKNLFEGVLADGEPGFLGGTRYESLEDPDMLVEIADWESSEARDRYMQESAVTGAFAPLMELCAAPLKATVLREFP
jgi:quinol monooxygenase YgiN